MASLTYERIDPDCSEIRLLKIGGADDGGIQCELMKHELSSCPEYYALSYVWGDPNVTKNITVDKQTFL
jgi:hypothetical protein